jgi:hypothetical protein
MPAPRWCGNPEPAGPGLAWRDAKLSPSITRRCELSRVAADAACLSDELETALAEPICAGSPIVACL